MQGAKGRAEVFLLNGHPVTRVEALGLVTAVEVRAKLTAFALDDSTGSVACVLWVQPRTHPDPERHCPALGDVVLVRGRLSVFEEASQIVVSTVRTLCTFSPLGI